jgi:hypothetical protein
VSLEPAAFDRQLDAETLCWHDRLQANSERAKKFVPIQVASDRAINFEQRLAFGVEALQLFVAGRLIGSIAAEWVASFGALLITSPVRTRARLHKLDGICSHGVALSKENGPAAKQRL